MAEPTSPHAEKDASARRLRSSGPEPFEACPDGGRCWHDCPLLPASTAHPEGEGLPCWRVHHAVPIRGGGEGWTPEERARHVTPPEQMGAMMAEPTSPPDTTDATLALAELADEFESRGTEPLLETGASVAGMIRAALAGERAFPSRRHGDTDA